MEAEIYSGTEEDAAPMGMDRDIIKALESKKHMLALISMKGSFPRRFIEELYRGSIRQNKKLILVGNTKDIGWMSTVVKGAEGAGSGKGSVVTFTSRNLICSLDGSGNDTGDLLNHCVRKDRMDLCEFQSGFDLEIYRQIKASGGSLLTEMEEEIRSRGMCPARIAVDLASEAQTIVSDHNFVFSEGWDKVFKFMGQDPKDCILGICDPSTLIDHLRKRFSYSFKIEDMDIGAWEVDDLPVEAGKAFSALLDVMRDISISADPKKPLERKWIIQGYHEKAEERSTAMGLGTLGDNLKMLLNTGNFKTISGRKKVKDIYLFLKLWMNEHSSVARTLEMDRDDRQITLSLLDLQLMIRPIMESFPSVVMFGDTLYPQGLYTALLGLRPENTLNRSYVSNDLMKRTTVLSIGNVDTSYKQRNETQYHNIVRNLERIIDTTPGTCVAIMPSYHILDNVLEAMDGHRIEVPLIIEERGLHQSDRRSLVDELKQMDRVLALTVQGSYISRGIEEGALAPETVVLVGVHIPPPTPVSNQLKVHLQKRHGTNLGHVISVFMPAMTKVMRMVNSMADLPKDKSNLVVLMDRRYQDRRVMESLPRFYNIKRLQSDKDYDGERYFTEGSSDGMGP